MTKKKCKPIFPFVVSFFVLHTCIYTYPKVPEGCASRAKIWALLQDLWSQLLCYRVPPTPAVRLVGDVEQTPLNQFAFDIHNFLRLDKRKSIIIFLFKITILVTPKWKKNLDTIFTLSTITEPGSPRLPGCCSFQ